MTRDEKNRKKLARAEKRREKQRNRTAFDYSNVRSDVPLWAARKMARQGYEWGVSWDDPNSPTGRSQVCDWSGICQSPCNGDC